MKKRINLNYLYLLLLISNYNLYADSFKILFIGNSFTHMNNFPMMFKELAATSGDTLEVDYSAVDSYTLEKHSKYSETLEKIAYGCWDYVVLQEQSQRPATDSNTFYNKTLFYANYIDSIIKIYNPNAQVLLFMTWGRKNGDKELCKKFPDLCSYIGMQNKLSERYYLIASKLAMSVVPCGTSWEYFQTNQNLNINLYDEDEKHPNEIGSYLNACVFYSVLLKKSPQGLTYNPMNIPIEELFLIQKQAYSTVENIKNLFDSIRNH